VPTAGGEGPICGTSTDCCDSASSVGCSLTIYGPQCCNLGNQPCRSNADCCSAATGSSYGNCNPNAAGTAMICCAAQGQACDLMSTCCSGLTCARTGGTYLCE
jgi:hypothetical protein